MDKNSKFNKTSVRDYAFLCGRIVVGLKYVQTKSGMAILAKTTARGSSVVTERLVYPNDLG